MMHDLESAVRADLAEAAASVPVTFDLATALAEGRRRRLRARTARVVLVALAALALVAAAVAGYRLMPRVQAPPALATPVQTTASSDGSPSMPTLTASGVTPARTEPAASTSGSGGVQVSPRTLRALGSNGAAIWRVTDGGIEVSFDLGATFAILGYPQGVTLASSRDLAVDVATDGTLLLVSKERSDRFAVYQRAPGASSWGPRCR